MEEFDYIIIGGGPSGLTIANRISELPNITVAVIEAGGDAGNDPNVLNINGYTKSFGASIDWQYQSSPQEYASGKIVSYHSGKALGGTTTINGGIYFCKNMTGFC
jgi:choline dehydrogenase-like flavoprotein